MIRYFIPVLFGSLLFGQVTSIPTASGGGGGGVNVPSGTSGGIPCYTAASTIASSSALTSNAVVKGGGAGACPTASGVTVDSSNNVVVPGNITTGTSGGGAVLLNGSSSGVVTVSVPAAPTTGTWTVPGGTDTFVGQGSRISFPAGFINGVKATPKTIYANPTGATNNDVYTAPNGKRALILTASYYNTSGGTILGTTSLKSGGNYYVISQNPTAATVSAVTDYIQIVLEPGESYSVNPASTGYNMVLQLIEFDSTYPLYSPKLTTFVSGDNTLYTVPANKTAQIFGYDQAGGSFISFNQWSTSGSPWYYNGSGGARSVYVNYVPSGGSVASTNRLTPATSVSSTAHASFTKLLPTVLNTGDFVSINTNANTAGQIAWLIVYEY